MLPFPAMITFLISGSFRKTILCLHILFGWETSFSDYFVSIISSLSHHVLSFQKLWEMRSSSLFITGNKQLFHASLCFRKQSWIHYSPTHWILNVASLGCKRTFSALSRMEPMLKCLMKVSKNFHLIIYKIQPNSRTGFTVSAAFHWAIQASHLVTFREAGVTVHHFMADQM